MRKQIVHQGFADFARGTMGNAGQNLYVSRQGILQRIYRFDTTGNGYFDIMITNSHDYNEKPRLRMIAGSTTDKPVFKDILTDGSSAAAVADLNNDGYDDLVIGSQNNGHHSDLAAFVYYGGPDGFTENHKIELSAPGCLGVACGDFNGDGRVDIALIIEGGKLRLYYQTEVGFLRDGYVDLEIDLTHISGGDLDGDGFADLYVRVRDDQWLVLWGGPDGIRPADRSVVGPRTDDTIFDVLPFGGGNLRYTEMARPKILRVDGRTLLLYCQKDRTVLKQARPDRGFDDWLTLDVPAVISAAAGDIDGDGRDDLVLLSRPSLDGEQAVILHGGEQGWDTENALYRKTSNARNVVIDDLSGRGFGDIAICQGRDEVRHTTESLVFVSGAEGVSEEPIRYVTHDAIDVFSVKASDLGKELIFVNHSQSDTYGHVPAYVFIGDRDGYQADRRVELPGHSAGSILPADFNDDGYTDILLLNNGEDQPHLLPQSSIFWGGPDGLDPTKETPVPTYLSWGAQLADINRDGYLDIVFTSTNQQAALNRNLITVLYGNATGYSLENSLSLEFEPGNDFYGFLWPVLADLNGDGWLDLCVPVSNKTYSLIFWGGEDGFSKDRCQKLPVERAVTARAADLNGNGWPDLIFGTRASVLRNKGHEGSVVIFWGGPQGYDASRCCELPSYQSNNITVADFNGDGYLDLFVSSYFNGRERDVNSYLYWNDRGSFSVTNRQRFFAHSSSAAMACDLNEDGRVDLIVSHHRTYGSHRTESAIWWNSPEGFEEKNRSFLPSLGPHDMVGVDVGNILDRGPEEYYLSPVVELPRGAVLEGISWDADVPDKTWIRATIRSADAPEKLDQQPFSGPADDQDGHYLNHDRIGLALGENRFVQYRLALGAINSVSTPKVRAVTLDFTE